MPAEIQHWCHSLDTGQPAVKLTPSPTYPSLLSDACITAQSSTLDRATIAEDRLGISLQTHVNSVTC